MTPAVQAGEVEFPGSDGAAVKGYLSQPADAGAGDFAVVLVCHESRADRAHPGRYPAAGESRVCSPGGRPAVAQRGQRRTRLGRGPRHPGEHAAGAVCGRFPQRMGVSQGQPGGGRGAGGDDRILFWRRGHLAGGGEDARTARGDALLRPGPEVEDIPGIQAPVLAIYGGNDLRINGSIPAVEAAMQANNKVYEKVIYDGADHAFFNDTGSRYNPEAAADAWARMLAWFRKYLEPGLI